MATSNSRNKQQRGSSSVRGGALSRLFSGDTGASTDVADWSSVDANAIQRVIAAFAAAGGAVRFGYSRDGGAYSLGVYLEDDHETLYFKPYENVTAKLTELVERLNMSNDTKK